MKPDDILRYGSREVVDISQFRQADRCIHVSQLRWDKDGVYGQIRKMRDSLVTFYIQRLRQRLPLRNMVRALLLDRGGVYLLLVYCWIHDIFLAGGLYVPLGGQHIAAALWHIWQEELSGGTPEGEIPEKHKFVMAELLIPSTPGHIRALAAGEHQADQSEVMGVMTADVFKHITNRCRANVIMYKKAGKKETDVNPHLTDGQLTDVLMSVGLMQKMDPKRVDAIRIGQRSKKTAEQIAV
jgi:hypothetical protein